MDAMKSRLVNVGFTFMSRIYSNAPTAPPNMAIKSFNMIGGHLGSGGSISSEVRESNRRFEQKQDTTKAMKAPQIMLMA